VQLSTLSGPVMTKAENSVKYLANYLTHFLRLLTSIEVKNHEVFGFSMIIRKLLLFHHAKTDLKELPSEIFNSLMQQMFGLTMKLIEGSAMEEIVSFQKQKVGIEFYIFFFTALR
jgi:hypothetical protein